MNKKHWLLGHKGTRGTAHMSAGKSARGIILVVLLLVLSFLSDATMNTRAIEHDEDARLQEFEMWDAEKLKLTADAFLFGEADGIKYESHAEVEGQGRRRPRSLLWGARPVRVGGGGSGA